MIEFFGWKERKMKWWDTHISNISIWTDLDHRIAKGLFCQKK